MLNRRLVSYIFALGLMSSSPAVAMNDFHIAAAGTVLTTLAFVGNTLATTFSFYSVSNESPVLQSNSTIDNSEAENLFVASGVLGSVSMAAILSWGLMGMFGCWDSNRWWSMGLFLTGFLTTFATSIVAGQASKIERRTTGSTSLSSNLAFGFGLITNAVMTSSLLAWPKFTTSCQHILNLIEKSETTSANP